MIGTHVGTRVYHGGFRSCARLAGTRLSAGHLRYRHRVALMLADAGLDPDAFGEAEMRRLESAVRRCYMRRKPAALAA